MRRAIRSILSRRLGLALAPILLLGGLVAAGATPAMASPCQVPVYVDPDTETATQAATVWPVATYTSSVSGGGVRSVCWNVGLTAGNRYSRYYRFEFSDQDTIDYGDDSRSICIGYTTPGSTVVHVAVCDTNSADWVINGNGLEVSLVVDSWASGPPQGYTWGIYVDLGPGSLNRAVLVRSFHLYWV